MQTILIVDDNIDQCKPLAMLLKQFGYNSQYAIGGEAALSFVAVVVPDLVILDVMMPDIDGLEVLRRLKADIRTYPVPVVMFSAADDLRLEADALSMGAADYWVKTRIDYSRLKDRIARLLRVPDS
jgi:PleD family two-component response regulator